MLLKPHLYLMDLTSSHYVVTSTLAKIYVCGNCSKVTGSHTSRTWTTVLCY
jgi:hypothetical protein